LAMSGRSRSTSMSEPCVLALRPFRMPAMDLGCTGSASPVSRRLRTPNSPPPPPASSPPPTGRLPPNCDGDDNDDNIYDDQDPDTLVFIPRSERPRSPEETNDAEASAATTTLPVAPPSPYIYYKGRIRAVMRVTPPHLRRLPPPKPEPRQSLHVKAAQEQKKGDEKQEEGPNKHARR